MSSQNQNQFDQYQLSEDIHSALELLGYSHPTEIQQQVIPPMLEGKHVVAKAPTGSGKTAAFAVPVCEAVEWEENLPQALVLEPTRELAVQVREEMFLIGRKKRMKAQAVFGGFPIDKQMQSLRQKTHVVIGTPGRVLDLMERDSLKLGKVAHLVIDEADLMLDMGFLEDVKTVLSQIPAGCRVALFSATLKPEIRELIKSHVENPEDLVLVEQEASGQSEPAILQKLYETEADKKYETLLNVLMTENPESCMIFCGTREMVNVLFQKLRRSRIFCGMLHGEIDQKERLKTVDAFRRGGFRFLIATDVAARGIDFEGITHVINFDFPTGRETYVHRIGRTGRNGKTGTAVSLVCEEDRRMLEMVEEYTGNTFSVIPCTERTRQQEKEFFQSQRKPVERKPGKGEALSRGIICLSIGGGRKSKMRSGDLVGAICGIDGVEVEDIGIIDIRDSLSYVEILHDKGNQVLEGLQTRTIKGKVRKVRVKRRMGGSPV